MISRLPTFNRDRYEVALIFVGIYMIFKGFGYLHIIPHGYLPRGVDLISQFVTMETWGLVWMLIGVWCFFGAWNRSTENPYAAFCGLMISWGCAHIYGAIYKHVMENEVSQSIVAGSGYLCLGTVVAILSNRRTGKAAVRSHDE